jgi:hypothetical protein
VNNIFLTEAANKRDALRRVADFLNAFRDVEFDWWMVGGSWTWCQHPAHRAFRAIAEKHLPGAGKITLFERTPDGRLDRPWGMHDDHDQLSDVIGAEEPRFWGLVDEARNAYLGEIDRTREELHLMVTDLHALWSAVMETDLVRDETDYGKKAREIVGTVAWLSKVVQSRKWTIMHHFWNIIDSGPAFDKTVIEGEPRSWFLVNADVHC